MGGKLYFFDGARASKAVMVDYDSEDALQEIVANNPDLLIRPDAPEDYKLYLAQREQKILTEAGETAYWADHLFVDSDGFPVIVETKLLRNAEIHRKVAAQMLDYAARLSKLDLAHIRSKVEAGGMVTLPESYWNTLRDNLSLSRMKMVFVADEIPPSLAPIIQFMDAAMQNIEVYGVSIRRHETDDGPGVLHVEFVEREQTGKTRPKRDVMSWNADLIFKRIEEAKRPEDAQLFSTFLSRCDEIGIQYSFGSGPKIANVTYNCGGTWLFWTETKRNGMTFVEFKAGDEVWSGVDILDELNRLPGVDQYISVGRVNTSFNIKLLGIEDNLDRFIGLVHQAVSKNTIKGGD